MKKQVFNPFLPLDEYIPDGEPHVFGDRIYLFGSHDTEGGDRYCAEGNYVCWSAPVNDLSEWRFEGEIYSAKQDPNYQEGKKNDLYAPDVVQGNDGKYYLYYNLVNPDNNYGFYALISVAVSDTPAGKYEYYGFVKNPDGSPFRRFLVADPAVINDDGIIRLYYGWSLSLIASAAHGRGGEPDHEAKNMPREQVIPVEQMMFKRSKEELENEPLGIMGANTVQLADDMLTIAGEPKRIVPGQLNALGSGFEGHAFYEASSIRKINGIYYFIYSSQESHELCYATSRFPDRDFVYRGTIISNGDVGYQGRKPKDRLNMTANNHGSLECVNNQWYIFYHRHTHSSTYSRQACAEPVYIKEDGSIEQVECTSCGLNKKPLLAEGDYPAPIACNITNGRMPHITNRVLNEDIPYITHDNGERFITNIKEGTIIGFKYFEFNGAVRFKIKTRGEGEGQYKISVNENTIGEISVIPSSTWKESNVAIDVFEKKGALYLTYQGSCATELLSIGFEALES